MYLLDVYFLNKRLLFVAIFMQVCRRLGLAKLWLTPELQGRYNNLYFKFNNFILRETVLTYALESIAKKLLL